MKFESKFEKSTPENISIFRTFKKSKKIQKNFLEFFFSDSVGSQYELQYAMNVFN